MGRLLCSLGLFCLALSLAAQPARTLAWRNPSLEGRPAPQRLPHGWYFCNFPGESPPDTHPRGLFGVETPPDHGISYVGMVHRPSGSYERIGQSLSAPLQSGVCYELSVSVARSPHYRSVVRETGRPVDYNQPLRLQISGGRHSCDTAFVLALSAAISDTTWQRLHFRLAPPLPLLHLSFAARAGEEDPAAGHLLIDRLGPLLAVDCNSGERLDTLPRMSAPAPPANREEWLRNEAGPAFARVFSGPYPPVAFVGPRGDTLQGDSRLYEVLRVWQQLPPEQRPEIGIRADTRLTYRQLAQQLLFHFYEFGAPTEGLRFRRLGRRAAPARWRYHDPQSLCWLR